MQEAEAVARPPLEPAPVAVDRDRAWAALQRDKLEPIQPVAPDLFLPLITVYIFLAVASGGVGSPAGALAGAYLLMTLLESARFVVDVIPAVTAVQRAALKELLIAVALIVVLRLMPAGVLPERIPPAPRLQSGGNR